MSENSSERRDSVRFSGNVSPSDHETHTMRVQRDATIEEVAVRFYAGPRLDLHVEPFVDVGESSGSNRIPIVQQEGDKGYIDGDNDYWIFPVSESVEVDDEIGVYVENVDEENSYDFTVDVVLDRAGGTARAASSFLSRVTGGVL